MLSFALEDFMINNKMFKLGTNRSAIRELFEYGNTLKATIGEDNVYDFTLGNPSVLPPEKVNLTIKKLLDTCPQSIHAYTSATGDKGVRANIAKWLNAKFNTNYFENNILMTTGAAGSLTTVLNSISGNPNGEVIAVAPFFPEYRVFTETAGLTLTVVNANLNDFSLDLNAIEKAINANTEAIIINSPNNPTGAVYSESEIIELAKVLKQKSEQYNKPIYVISDEPYREIAFDNLAVPFIPCYYDNTIVCYSFSKSLSLPGERIGYIAISNKATDWQNLYFTFLGSARALGYVCAPSLFQFVINECLDTPSDIEVYKTNRDILVKALTEYGYECNNPKGAFYLFLKSPIKSAEEFSEHAKKLGLLLVPSTSFGVDGYLRIATCVSTKTVNNSLKVFKQLADKFIK